MPEKAKMNCSGNGYKLLVATGIVDKNKYTKWQSLMSRAVVFFTWSVTNTSYWLSTWTGMSGQTARHELSKKTHLDLNNLLARKRKFCQVRLKSQLVICRNHRSRKALEWFLFCTHVSHYSWRTYGSYWRSRCCRKDTTNQNFLRKILFSKIPEELEEKKKRNPSWFPGSFPYG